MRVGRAGALDVERMALPQCDERLEAEGATVLVLSGDGRQRFRSNRDGAVWTDGRSASVPLSEPPLGPFSLPLFRRAPSRGELALRLVLHCHVQHRPDTQAAILAC